MSGFDGSELPSAPSRRYTCVHCGARGRRSNSLEQRMRMPVCPACERTGRCGWTEDLDGNWGTSCGETFTFTDGGPRENRAKFCQYCGGLLTPKNFSPSTHHP